MPKTVKQQKLQKYEQDAPVYAEQTCPHIDMLINMLDTEVKTLIDEKNLDFYEDVSKLFVTHLEYIRTANDSLRNSGIYWKTMIKKEL